MIPCNINTQDSVTREICIRILEYLGALPYAQSPKNGLVQERYLLPENLWLVAQYENSANDIYYPVYAGSTLTVDSKTFRLLLSDVSNFDAQEIEFYLLFQLGALPVHCLHFLGTQNEYQCSITLFHSETKTWQASTLQTQASNLIGFDTLYQAGRVWTILTEYQDLYQILNTILA